LLEQQALELAEKVAAEAAELAAKGADVVNAERAALPPLSADTDVLMDSDGDGASATAGDGSGVSAAAAARAVVTQEQLDAVNVQVCILQHIHSTLICVYVHCSSAM
jgi:hypothetical protein